MLRLPAAAPPLTTKEAVSVVAETTDTLDTVIPAPALIVAPATNPDPVTVTAMVAPAVPWLGVTELTVTAAAAIENPPVSVPVPPPGLMTLTSRAPDAAPAAMVSVAVSCVADTREIFDAEIPTPALRVAPVANPDPLIVTATAVPGAP